LVALEPDATRDKNKQSTLTKSKIISLKAITLQRGAKNEEWNERTKELKTTR
jgi:hypothetical protein